MTEIFSSGGGTQSAAIAALIVQGRLPRPDFVCIVDTERERQTTWDYLDSVIRPALASVGLEVHRIRKSEWGSKPPHGLDYMSHNKNTMLLPAWSNQTGDDPGKLSGFCSNTWKVETMERYARKVLGVPVDQQRRWIGFSLDETRRAVRVMAGQDYKAGRIRLPLIKDIPITRRQAIAVVEKMGWPTPPRSACWMCPNQGDDEWRDLKENHPEEFAAAVALEKEIQQIDPFAWLHKSCVPLDQVEFKSKDQPDYCSSGACFI